MGITLWQSLSEMAERMANDAFSGIGSLDDWQKARPGLQREFARCLGLDPLPERCDLKVAGHGEFAGPGYRARRLSFQIMPDCWSTAAVYYPDPAPAAPAPGVLYVCGHAAIGTWHYQYHPVMWARRGYVCLIVDTIEQNDNPGEHHGFTRGNYDSWLSMGYTSAGGEVWNSVRALDVLASDERVDAGRLAVTGISGGGAVSFHLAVLDERVKAVSTLCGVSTPRDGIVNRHVLNHCNCIYPYNVYRRDTSEYAALIAPRAAVFCFADDDALFHPEESRALVERASRIYRFYGVPERCRLVACPGAHADHPEFDEATAEMFDRYAAGEARPTVKRGGRDLAERVTGVFNGRPPAPNRLELLPRLISPRGSVPLPEKPEDWPAIRRAALASLPPLELSRGDEARLAPAGAWLTDTSALRAYRGQVAGVDIWLHTRTLPGGRPRLVLGVAGPGETSHDLLGRIAVALEPGAAAAGGLETRFAGTNSPAPETGAFPFTAREDALGKMLPFALSLVGATPVMLMIQDLQAALDFLSNCPETAGHEIYLYGRGDAAAVAIYGALLDERVAGVAAADLPASHLDGAPIMGILRSFDLPEAVGLVAPRKIALVEPGHSNWTWPSRAFERLGCADNFIMAGDLRQALARLLA